MLLLGWKTELDEAALEQDPIAELERLYKTINADESRRDEAQAELVKLQAGDEENHAIWKRMIALSQEQFDRLWPASGDLRRDVGREFYNRSYQADHEELQEKGIAEESEGRWWCGSR